MIKNSCATVLDTVDFGLKGCPAGGPCSVPPTAQNGVELWVDGDGKKQWLFHVQNDSTDYALSISATVANFNGNPGGCEVGGAPGRKADPVGLTVGLAALVGLVFWRRR
jgi:MYXO-CTERM domain-containing protein